VKVICCTCQPNELERETKHITRGWDKLGGQPKIWAAMAHTAPSPPLIIATTHTLRWPSANDDKVDV